VKLPCAGFSLKSLCYDHRWERHLIRFNCIRGWRRLKRENEVLDVFAELLKFTVCDLVAQFYKDFRKHWLYSRLRPFLHFIEHNNNWSQIIATTKAIDSSFPLMFILWSRLDASDSNFQHFIPFVSRKKIL
jgi:hypothetical protein